MAYVIKRYSNRKLYDTQESRYVTLEPGDVIFTGTPGTTQAMKPGDTFEVEIEGIGVLRNRIERR